MSRIKIKVLDDNHYIIKSLIRKNIDIYNIEYDKKYLIYTIDESSLDKIPFDVEIISYHGIKGLVYYLKRHKHFILSLIISIILMFVISNIVIKVEVIHNDSHIRELILEELDNSGIHPLTFKKSFNYIQRVKDSIKDKYPEDIEWLEIIDNGMNYVVRVEERIITKEEDTPPYCDIISIKDAIVQESVVRHGQSIVMQNDYVKKDSILISGAIKFNEEIKSYTCADADVYGNTWYTVTISIPYNYIDKEYTGKIKHNIAFEYGSKRISIFKTHLDKFDTKRSVIFTLGKFTIYKETMKEYKENKSRYSEKEIKELGLQKGRENLEKNLDSDASIQDEKVLQTNSYNSIIEMEIFYSVKERISKQIKREIPIRDGGNLSEAT